MIHPLQHQDDSSKYLSSNTLIDIYHFPMRDIFFNVLSETFEFFRHPIAVFFHMAFRSLAIVAYFVCSWAKASFVTSFVIIIILLSMDFWTVKNITGRLLAGLRYWNYVDDAGNNHWIFESKKVSFPKCTFSSLV